MPLFGNKKANKTEKLGDRYLAATFRERGLLGLVLADHERGAMVQNYQEHSPAAKVELPFGALIVGVNGEEVVGMPPEAVELAVAQVAEENRLNEVEYDEVVGEKIINAPPPKAAPPPAAPVPEAPAPEAMAA